MGRVLVADLSYWNYQAEEFPEVSDPYLVVEIETYTAVKPESKRRIVWVLSRLKEPEPRSLRFQGIEGDRTKWTYQRLLDADTSPYPDT